MAMTGALSAGVCYASQPLALDAYYGATLPSFLSGSSVYYTVTKKGVTGWSADTYRVGTGGTATLQTSSLLPVLSFPPCDPTEHFIDGLSVGWAIAAVMAAAWGWRMIREQAK